MEFKKAKLLIGDLQYVTSHKKFAKEQRSDTGSIKLWESLSSKQKAEFCEFLKYKGLGRLSPYGMGTFGTVLESAKNQLVTIYDANSDKAHISRIKSNAVLQTLVEPIQYEITNENGFKIDVTPKITDVEEALKKELVSTRDTVLAFYKLMDVIIGNKLRTWTEDFYMCYNPRDLYERSQPEMIRDLRFMQTDLRPDPDDVMRVFYIQNTGFLNDFKTMVTYDAGCIRAGSDSTLDEETSPEQIAHAKSLGLEYGKIKQVSEPEAAGAIAKAAAFAKKLRG